MAEDLSFSCDCGEVAGVLHQVGPKEGDRYVCYCGDCRDLTRHLGCADKVLDEYGGTDLYQTRCAKMRITSGKDRLACLHMTDKPTTRWYAECCNTPMFNTLDTGKFPFVTTTAYPCDPARRDAVLGPPKGYLFTKEATADPGDVYEPSTFTLMRRVIWRAIKDRLSGDFRRAELFDGKTLEPIAQPRRLTEEEQRALGRD